MDEVYLIIEQLLYTIDNTSMINRKLRESPSAQRARQWCLDYSNRVHSTLPVLVREHCVEICPRCGWDKLRVLIRAVALHEKFPPGHTYVCMTPIETGQQISGRDYTVGMSYISNIAITHTNEGPWVIHEKLCGKPRPDDPSLAKVWDGEVQLVQDRKQELYDSLRILDEVDQTLERK